MFFVHSSDDGHLDYFHIFSSVQFSSEERNEEGSGEEAAGGGGKQGHGQICMETVTAWRRNRLSRPHSWSHVDKLRVATGCWKAETHFFIAEVKLRPWEVLEASTPGVPTPGCEGPLVTS